MRILWIDFETGGLKPGYHEPLTCAGIIEVNKEVVDTFDYKIRPMYPDRLDPMALKVNGFNKEQVMQFPDRTEAFLDLKKKFIKYGVRGNKLILGGHNVGFDRGFLDALFEDGGCKTLYYWLDYHNLDTMSVAAWLRYVGMLDIKTLKLEALCQHFNIELKAHDALEDIKATRELARALQRLIK